MQESVETGVCDSCGEHETIPQGKWSTQCRSEGCEQTTILSKTKPLTKYVQVSCTTRTSYHIVGAHDTWFACRECMKPHEIGQKAALKISGEPVYPSYLYGKMVADLKDELKQLKEENQLLKAAISAENVAKFKQNLTRLKSNGEKMKEEAKVLKQMGALIKEISPEGDQEKVVQEDHSQLEGELEKLSKEKEEIRKNYDELLAEHEKKKEVLAARRSKAAALHEDARDRLIFARRHQERDELMTQQSNAVNDILLIIGEQTKWKKDLDQLEEEKEVRLCWREAKIRQTEEEIQHLKNVNHSRRIADQMEQAKKNPDMKAEFEKIRLQFRKMMEESSKTIKKIEEAYKEENNLEIDE